MNREELLEEVNSGRMTLDDATAALAKREIEVAIAAIAYLKEHGLILTAYFSEENPPSKEVEALLLDYVDEAADNFSLEAEENVIDIIQGDWLEDYVAENGGQDGQQ